jgi:hypothetical protein
MVRHDEVQWVERACEHFLFLAVCTISICLTHGSMALFALSGVIAVIRMMFSCHGNSCAGHGVECFVHSTSRHLMKLIYCSVVLSF